MITGSLGSPDLQPLLPVARLEPMRSSRFSGTDATAFRELMSITAASRQRTNNPCNTPSQFIEKGQTSLQVANRAWRGKPLFRPFPLDAVIGSATLLPP